MVNDELEGTWKERVVVTCETCRCQNPEEQLSSRRRNQWSSGLFCGALS